jgi:hypothetical protein
LLGIGVSRLQKRGFKLEEAVALSSSELRRLLIDQQLPSQSITAIFLKDRLWKQEFFELLTSRRPELHNEVNQLTELANHYQSLANESAIFEL